MWIQARYRCPKIRTDILIYDDTSLTKKEDRKIREQSKTKKVSLEDIHHVINRNNTTKNLQWTMKIVPASDFLEALKSRKCEKLGVSIHSSHNPESIELLAICLENSSCVSGSLNTVKILDSISEKDVIQVFI